MANQRPIALATLLVAVCFAALPCKAQLIQADDPFTLVLILADLNDADKAMATHDVNEDGLLDDKEQATLRWPKSGRSDDINRDGRLTHLEIAIHFAAQRKENDVKQIDRTVVTRAMQMYDKNRNGQIDPDEITSAWPDDPDEIDVDKNGILTQTELANAFAFRRVVREEIGIIGVDQGWAIKIRNRFDQNRDGGLNPDEWSNTPMPDSPSAFDEDKDQRLTVLEIATMLAKHRQKLGLTANDQLAARALIASFDKDFSGVVSASEWKPVETLMSDEVRQLKEFDSNKDDAISLLEIETLLSKRRDELGFTDRDAEAAKVMIRRHDDNHDLRISASELKESSGNGFLGKEDLPQVDRNQDGVIDQEELARYLARESSSK